MIKKPVVLYKEINDGFQVSNEGEITFEKASASTHYGLRDTIVERYKKGKILKICKACTKNCKQVLVHNVIFTCFQQEKK